MYIIYGEKNRCAPVKAIPPLYEAILGDKMKEMSKSGTGTNVSDKIPKLLYDGVFRKQNFLIVQYLQNVIDLHVDY